MLKPFRLSIAVAAALLSVGAFAQGVLQPLPTPDLSKLAPAAAKQLSDDRAEIDKAKSGLIGPPLAQVYADLGVLYARNGFDEVAGVAFYDASQIDPNDGRWYYFRGLIARKLKRNEDARTNFQAAFERDKIYLPIRYRLADTLIELNDMSSARKLLDDTARDYADQPVVYAMLGQLALKQKRYADAVGNINQALKLDPKANELYRHLADAYVGQGNTKAADEARAKAGNVTTALSDPLAAGLYASPQAQVGGTPFEQAQTLARQGNIAAARDKLVQILEKNPRDVDALSLSARINAATGNFAIARIEVDEALKTNPDSAIANLTSGMVAEYVNDEKKAIEDYQHAQRLDAKQPDTWLLLGNAEMRRTRFAQAAEQYRQLVVLQPTTAEAYAHLVAALVAQGKCDDALQTVNAALAKRANDGDLIQLFVRVASTCKAASAKERDTALEYGQSLYKQRPDEDNSTALALALAAHGKFKEAQEYQAEAIFHAVSVRDGSAAAQYKATTQEFYAQQKVPDRPWSADHRYFKAPMLLATRVVPAPAAPAAAPAKP